MSETLDASIDCEYLMSSLELVDPALAEKLDSFCNNDDDSWAVWKIKSQIGESYGEYNLDKPDDVWRSIIDICGMINVNVYNIEHYLLKKEPETIKSLSIQKDKFINVVKSVDKERRALAKYNLESIVAPFIVAYNKETFDNATVDKIVDYAREGVLDYDLAKNIGIAVDVVGKNNDPECLPVYIDYYKELVTDVDNELGGFITKDYLLRSYFKAHGLDNKRVQGFKNKLFPLIANNDPEVRNLGTGNSYPMRYGWFAISDFITHSLVSEVNPKNVRDLIQAYYEVPTSDFAKFEQNRKDALMLEDVLWAERSWIHDEVPGVHGLLVAMLGYYDAQDNKNACQEKRGAIVDAVKRLPINYQDGIGDLSEYCLNLKNYDRPVAQQERVYTISNGGGESAINVLRRLVKNTEQETLDKPRTGEEELDVLLQQLKAQPNKQTGEIYVNWRQAGELVTYVNKLLLNCQGEIGMRPSMVQALAYTEKMATYAIRGVGYKDWTELPYDKYFKEFVKFRDLTASANRFDEKEFERFWGYFVKMDWPDDIEKTYKKLSCRILKQMDKLATSYNKSQYTARMVNSLWSGNLTGELLSLTNNRLTK